MLLLGQYSTGKTTFIKHLLQRDYPGCHIGPEPTTDRFVIVNHGHEERITPGNTLCVMPDKPYTGLTAFGTGFLSKFQSASCPARLLEEITIVDTPGVLSGEKQRIERSYNFIEARDSLLDTLLENCGVRFVLKWCPLGAWLGLVLGSRSSAVSCRYPSNHHLIIAHSSGVRVVRGAVRRHPPPLRPAQARHQRRVQVGHRHPEVRLCIALRRTLPRCVLSCAAPAAPLLCASFLGRSGAAFVCGVCLCGASGHVSLRPRTTTPPC